MLTTIIFPFLDSRNFLETDTYKLRKPTWPNIDIGKGFLRNFGSAENRLQGGSTEWAGEQSYCNGKNAIKFPYSCTDPNHEIAFRRFYHTGNNIARFEIGFRDNFEKSKFFFENRKKGLPYNSAFSLIHSYLTKEVEIHDYEKKLHRLNLYDAGNKLAKLYLYASTKKPKENILKLRPWWVSAGQPLVYTEFNLGNESKRRLFRKLKPSHIIKDDFLEQHGIHVFFMWTLSKSKYSIKTWFITYRHNTPFSLIRDLRINMLRIHTELEGLNIMLRFLGEEKLRPSKGTNSSDNLQQLLNKNIFLKAPSYIKKSQLVQKALYFEEIMNKGQKLSILNSLKKYEIRPNLIRKTNNNIDITQEYFNKNQPAILISNANKKIYIQELHMSYKDLSNNKGQISNNEISNSLISGGSSIGLINKIKNTGADDQIKDNLVLLTNKMDELISNIPNDYNEIKINLNDDLKSFVNEILKEKPRENISKSIYDNIKDALEKISGIATPIYELTKEVLPILVSIGKMVGITM